MCHGIQGMVDAAQQPRVGLRIPADAGAVGCSERVQRVVNPASDCKRNQMPGTPQVDDVEADPDVSQRVG